MFHEFHYVHIWFLQNVYIPKNCTVLHNTFFIGNCEDWWVQKGKDDLADISVIFFLYAVSIESTNFSILINEYLFIVSILWTPTKDSILYLHECIFSVDSFVLKIETFLMQKLFCYFLFLPLNTCNVKRIVVCKCCWWKRINLIEFCIHNQ